MIRWVVIVDQSEPPEALNMIQAFGPYTLMTAESIMAEINGEAMAGEINLNSIVIAPLNEGTSSIVEIASILKEKVS
jgi:hypothetical protein